MKEGLLYTEMLTVSESTRVLSVGLHVCAGLCLLHLSSVLRVRVNVTGLITLKNLIALL